MSGKTLGLQIYNLQIAFVRKSKELASTIEEFGVSSEDIIVLKQGYLYLFNTVKSDGNQTTCDSISKPLYL